MNAGDLDKQITVQTPSAGAADAFGEKATSWATHSTPWASIQPISGREMEYARSFAATVSHKVTVRYATGVTTAHRIIFGSRTFAINAVINPHEQNVKLELYCTELTTSA